MKSFLLKLVLGFLGLTALFIALTTFTKGFIYSLYSSHDFPTFIKKFAKVNIPWQLAWVILLMLSFKLVKPLLLPLVIWLELLMYIVLTPIYRSLFTKKQTNFRSMLCLGLKRIYLYIIPVLVISAFSVVNLLIWLLIFVKPGLIFIIVNFIFTMFLIIWGRVYILQVASDIR